MKIVLRPGAAVAVAAVSLAAVAVLWWLLDRPLGIDSAVYRAAGFAVSHGEPLYAPLSDLPGWAPELPFTYPPFAALVFVPLVALPAQLCWGLVAVAAPFAVFLVLREFTDRWWLVLVAFGLQPVWQSVGLGQLNLVLMAMVVIDVLRLRGSRFGGVLIGLAAAVKLVPLIFIGHLLLTGRRADAARAAGTFAAASTLGAVLLPGDSVRYWTSAVYSGHFAEMKAWVGNQSWSGFLARTWPEWPWLLGFAVVFGGVAVLLVRWRHRAGDDGGALLVTAGCALVVSPISWTHHWVWIVPALGWLLAAERLRSAAALAILFTGWTVAVVPGGQGRERHWTVWQALAGNAYLLTALAAGLFLLARLARSAGGRYAAARRRKVSGAGVSG
ncbi:glycosyltransferase 87 family protein [Amycolatopsis sp. NPDC048633]|uniref:glycosyltransferase 87 family protein n=1 Tax=Amycolatopsis sp. NPDC048633 TaxID=3157095 RepID=UPI00340EC036